VLAKHILYDPFPDMEDTRMRPLSIKLPAYGALLAIGLPSVPHLLTELKKTDPKSEKGDSYRKHRVLTWCICEIYDRGGTEIMGRKRLELELTVTEDKKERSNLRAALLDPFMPREAPNG
jgi:hypothetical protein